MSDSCKTDIIARYATATALFTLAFSLVSQILLRCLFLFLRFDRQFSEIFRQIADAKMNTPLLLTALLSAGYVLLISVLWKNGIAGKVFAVVIAMVFGILILAVCLLLTFVNGVMLLDVLKSLLPLLESGAI